MAISLALVYSDNRSHALVHLVRAIRESDRIVVAEVEVMPVVVRTRLLQLHFFRLTFF